MLCPLCQSVVEWSTPPPALAAADQAPPALPNRRCLHCGHSLDPTDPEVPEAQPEACPICRRVGDQPSFETAEGILVYDCGDHVFFAKKAIVRVPQ